MRPATRLLILLVLIVGLYEFFSLMWGNDALHKTAITQAYRFAVQLARRNEENRQLDLAMGSAPHSALPTDEELQGTPIRHMTYAQGGAIRIELDARSGVDGGVLFYLPLMQNGNISEWTCMTRDYPAIERFLPACHYVE